MLELPEAREVILRKTNPIAPPFHRHIARGQLVGKSCQVGDRVVIYEIEATVPGGRVMVTKNSLLRFK